MKTIQHSASARDKVLHVEAEGCIVNIRVGLKDDRGRPVTVVEVLADNYMGDQWRIEGGSETHHAVRVVRISPLVEDAHDAR